jgi:hypothetical protein
MGGVRIQMRNIAQYLSLDYIGFTWRDVLRNRQPPRDNDLILQLTPCGIIELAEDGHWIHIKGEKIDDKSKADVLQKLLVLVQVTWMATTCISRRIYGLPLTLLEIHTMVHVVCAISLYMFWLKVSEPSQCPARISHANEDLYRNL